MKTPDKIFVSADPFGCRTAYTEDECRPPECEEYIRKEALLEWAKEQMRLWEDRALGAIRSDTKYPIIVGTFGLKRDVFQMFIDKLNTI